MQSFLVNIKQEIRIFSGNVYRTYSDALPSIFGPLWFIFMAFGILIKIRSYLDSKDLDAIDSEMFLVAILVPYLAIVSLHNLALRHFAALVPFFIILTAAGVSQTAEFLRDFTKRESVFHKLVMILLLGVLFVSELPNITRPLRKPGGNPSLDSFLFTEAGGWIKGNLPPHPRIMSRKPFLSYYADGEWVPTPFASFDRILNYARAQDVEYLDINTKYIRFRPQLEFLLKDEQIPSSLELVKTFRRGAEELKLFSLKAASD